MSRSSPSSRFFFHSVPIPLISFFVLRLFFVHLCCLLLFCYARVNGLLRAVTITFSNVDDNDILMTHPNELLYFHC